MPRPAPRSYDNTKRKEQAALTRQRLLAAAARFIEDNEVEALSLPRIAKLAGVAAGTIYTHFEDEDALLLALIAEQRELTTSSLIDDELPLERLYEVPLRSYPLFERYRRLTMRLANSLALSQMRKASRRPVIARASARVQPLAPTLTPEELAAVAGAIHLFSMPRAWYWLEEHGGLSNEMAARAAAWATQSLVACLRANPEAIRDVPVDLEKKNDDPSRNDARTKPSARRKRPR